MTFGFLVSKSVKKFSIKNVKMIFTEVKILILEGSVLNKISRKSKHGSDRNIII